MLCTAFADGVNYKNKQEMNANLHLSNKPLLSVFFTSYLGLTSFRFAGRGGLTLGVGGGILVGNVARLA